MNYNNYIDSLSPRKELKERVAKAVKESLIEQNRAARRNKRIYVSLAACLTLFAVSAAALKMSDNSKPYILPSDTSVVHRTTVKNGTLPSFTPTTENTSIKPTHPTPSTSVVVESVEILNGNSNGEKCNPLFPMLVLEGAAYAPIVNPQRSDYCKACLRITDNRIEMEKADIGEKITVLDEKTFIDNEIDYTPLNMKETSESGFLGAEVYAYKKCANGTVIVVKNKDGYYLYHLLGIREPQPIDAVINRFTADGSNPIISVEILHQDSDVSKNSGGRIIRDSKKIETLRQMLCKDYKQISFDALCEKGYYDADRKEDYHVFDRLKFTFADGTTLEMNICKKYMSFNNVVTADDYGNYLYGEDDYDLIQRWINQF